MGIAALSKPGQSAVLYYLSGYLFTVMAAFIVIGVVLRHLETEDISGLAGLNERSPLLATTMTLAMVSLAGIPPLAGFFGKFLLLKAIIQSGGLWLGLVAIGGVVVSFYYYFGVIKAIYWSKDAPDLSPIRVGWPTRAAIYTCIAGMFYLGMFPSVIVRWTDEAVKVLKFLSGSQASSQSGPLSHPMLLDRRMERPECHAKTQRRKENTFQYQNNPTLCYR